MPGCTLKDKLFLRLLTLQKIRIWGNFQYRTCSAAVGARSWFLFSKASLNADSSAAGLTRGKAISHWNGIRHQGKKEIWFDPLINKKKPTQVFNSPVFLSFAILHHAFHLLLFTISRYPKGKGSSCLLYPRNRGGRWARSNLKVALKRVVRVFFFLWILLQFLKNHTQCLQVAGAFQVL